jgi:hypothetical protein
MMTYPPVTAALLAKFHVNHEEKRKKMVNKKIFMPFANFVVINHP